MTKSVENTMDGSPYTTISHITQGTFMISTLLISLYTEICQAYFFLVLYVTIILGYKFHIFYTICYILLFKQIFRINLETVCRGRWRP